MNELISIVFQTVLESRRRSMGSINVPFVHLLHVITKDSIDIIMDTLKELDSFALYAHSSEYGRIREETWEDTVGEWIR